MIYFIIGGEFLIAWALWAIGWQIRIWRMQSMGQIGKDL